MNTKLTIKSWAECDRPREKMQLHGKKHLTDAELIAILIGTGTRTKSAVSLAQELLHHFDNDLQHLGRLSLDQLMAFQGIGPAKAVSLAACFELSRRHQSTSQKRQVKITSSRTAYEHLQPLLTDLKHEEFYVLLLNRANHVLAIKQISVGGTAGTVADGKIIFSEALRIGASGIILAHNHPSGETKPSQADKQLTSQLVSFGKCIDLLILDHIIVGNQAYFSFADEGIL